MLRRAFVMQVHGDCHAEYECRHSPIWPELEQTLKAHGAHNYAIWLDAERNLLFASVEIESEERWNAVAQTEVCQRWWASMKDLMPSNPDNSPVSQALKPVFFLE
ncbi:L-rhamnose mutarotase [Pantoea sp. LMR881]|uniref:L-rhamnose mutarotase n=1 Tax=Pantoea sp. LMR881 TaxID=3014336 RepID=UPI0022AF85DF|nr:L-rhamnose mutarotase [Pantoea sp. LMR881]MCZ4058433.1 L-rhamnose mutarotase [Pantoea sp. LMR881]